MKAVYRLFYYLSIGVTFVMAIFTLAGAFATCVSPEQSSLLPFLGLALPILLLINAGMLAYWAIRWRYWVWVPFIAIVGNGAYLSRIFQFHGEADMTDKNLITVVSYNVNSFNRDPTGFSCKEIAHYMQDYQTDILCFQEFGTNQDFPIDSVKAVLAKWPYYYIPEAPAETPILQIAVFSRFPILDRKLITYPDSRNCSLWCDLDVNGRKIRLFNNHLQTTEASRNKRKLEKKLDTDDKEGSKQALLTFINGLHENFRKRALQAEEMNRLISASPYPALICGDFNSLPSSYTYQKMRGRNLKDGFQTCGNGYMYTFLYFKHLLRIDYIFHSPELQGVDYFSPGLDYSDHKPVVMRLSLD